MNNENSDNSNENIEKNENNENKTKKNTERRMIMRALGLLSQLGINMASCVLIGLVIGRFLDALFKTAPLFMIIFLFIGAGAAMKVMYDISKDWK